jgi:hypothetical protein
MRLGPRQMNLKESSYIYMYGFCFVLCDQRSKIGECYVIESTCFSYGFVPVILGLGFMFRISEMSESPTFTVNLN